MPGMKVTLSAAMRARDVSRPRPEDEQAAERADPPRPAGGPPRSRAEGNLSGEQPAAGAQSREDSAGRPAAIPKNAGGRPRRRRRLRAGPPGEGPRRAAR
jgi:hypothetical protein